MATWGDYSLRALIKKIVGANWDGTTIDRITEERPLIKFETQPVNTSADGVSISVNVYGFNRRLQQLIDGVWTNVGSVQNSSTKNATQSLSAITTTSICRILVWVAGGSDVYALPSDEFTVTRTAAQTQALKQNLTSGKLDTDVAETDVVETTIDKMETETVVEKTTTTKSK